MLTDKKIFLTGGAGFIPQEESNAMKINSTTAAALPALASAERGG
jgi:hypothetical protein